MQSSFSNSNDYQTTLKARQNDLLNIYKQRKRILQQINQKSKEKRFLSSSSDQLSKLKNIKSQSLIQDSGRKMVKKDHLSNRQISEDHAPKSQNNEESKINQKPSHVPQAITDRNRRIFGGLTSYLRKAGQHLQSKTQKQKQQNAKQILNKFISKEKQEREEIQNKKKQELQTQLNKLQQQKIQSEENIKKAENQLLSFIVKSHFNAVENFYLTRTQPKIFWKPKKSLEDPEKVYKIKQFGEKCLKKQAEQYMEKIVGYNQVCDHGKYMSQNQRQFYTNFIKNIYLDHKNFITTKTEPQLFWKPRKQFKGFENLVSETGAYLDQKSKSLNQNNIHHYQSKQSNFMEQADKQFSEQENEEYLEKAQ